METGPILDCAFDRWSPVIGDATFMGWVTVLAYAVASVSAFLVVADRRSTIPAVERAFWMAAGIGLAALAANKQLDLQSLLTAIGRCAARLQGWYDMRRVVQAEFILALIAASLLAGLVVLWLLRGTLTRTGLALFGLVWIVAFVLVRAVGFHHMDALIGFTVRGVRMNWVLELGGIGLFLLGTLVARRGRRRNAARSDRPRSPRSPAGR